MDSLTPPLSIILVTLFGLLLIAAFIRALSVLWNREDLYQSTKILWMIFIVIAPFIGILCYFLFGGRSDFDVEEEEDAV